MRELALAPALRGLVSGFGAVHLLWGLHDVDLLLRRLPRSSPPGGPAASH